MRRKELIDIYILEILSEYSSKKHKIYQKDIIRHLEEDYDLKVSRKTLGTYLSCLRDKGYIKGKRGIYKVNKFSDMEVRVLIDSVLYSKHIPQEVANELIIKLKELSSVDLRGKMRNVRYVNSLYRTGNDNLYNVLDGIDEGIEKNKKIRITRCQYNEKGELEDIGREVVDPYYIVASNSRYYVICYAGRGNKLESRRVDRISNLEILDEKREPLRNIIKTSSGFDLGKYMREHVYMFSGKSVPIKIKMKKRHISYFVDWFGNEFRAKNITGEDDYIELTTINNENASYYWALQFGEIAEILEPKQLRARVGNGLREILKKYQNNPYE